MKFVLEPDVYPLRFAVWLGPWEPAKVHRFLRERNLWCGRNHVEPPSATDAGCCYGFSGGSLIWLSKIPRSPYEIGMLTHEAVHAVVNGAKSLGFQLSPKSCEFFTYLTEYIVEGVLTRTRK